VAIHEDILQGIESAGYRVAGGRESIGDGQDGPLIVTTENIATGQRHTVTVHTKGIDGEGKALHQLAAMGGIALTDEKQWGRRQ